MIQAADYIGKPVTSLQTMLQMIAVNRRELPEVLPDGVFGKQTEACVRAYQKRAGLPVTGIVDRQTWDSIVQSYQACSMAQEPPCALNIILEPNQCIGPGEANRHLYLIQAMLYVLSECCIELPKPEFTGRNDAATQAAVQAFQRLCGEEPSGVIDKKFYWMLTGAYRSTAGNGIIR